MKSIYRTNYRSCTNVASFSEAWIEIRVRSFFKGIVDVASFSEAWIEIIVWMEECSELNVASFSEAWIEIIALAIAGEPLKSPPSRRRGLKYL